ncbi:MAG: hypothetical protein RLZZ579_473 [Actinomycetota bacterium]
MAAILSQFRLVLQPWPIRAIPLAVLITLFQVLVNFAIVIATARASGRWVQPIQILSTVPSILMGFFFGIAVLWTIRTISNLNPKYSTVAYWLGSVVFGFSMGLARFLAINDYTPEYWKDPASWVRIFVVSILLYLTVHISLGVASMRLQAQVNVAEAARTSLEIQRGKLISAQEDVRRQIADFLHDRLQSDLVLLGMQMQRSVEKLGEQEKSIAQAYIDEIERIRQFDVRNVAKQLVPELDGPSFRPALDDLISRYSKAISITATVQEQGGLARTPKLAAYRIVEQALLNAAKHANAKHVQIKIQDHNNQMNLVVRNDGAPLPENPVAGAGMAIIEDWVAQLGGNWTLNSVDGWTELNVVLRTDSKTN